MSPFQLPPDLHPNAERRALRAAYRILNGKIEIFGNTITVGSPPDWHRVLHAPGSWPLLPWWKIDIRSADRLGDVKWAWELGRHRHLVLLARAAYVGPVATPYLELLETHLRSWLDQNPPEMAVHWYSNLEIALRGIAWLQILSLVGDQLEQSTVMRMQETLYLTGRHLVADLPYTVSTMRNNHLIGDGLGLVALGLAFPDDRAARRWARIGDRLLKHQLRRHFQPDGSSIEDSLSYNRFVLEMLATRILLGGAPDAAVDALSNSSRYLARLGVFEGAVPQFGDWDEGRVLAVAENPEDVAGSVRLALSLVGTGAPLEWLQQYDEVAWFVGRGNPAGSPKALVNGSDAGGAIGRARAGEWTAWLKAGAGRSHGHADLLSAPIRYGDHWVVGDPGTGSYNGPIEQRNYFRSSSAHSVTRVEGLDQLEPHRAFRWKHAAEGRLGQPVVVDGTIIMWGIHDAYERLDPPRRTARVVAVAPGGVAVADWVEGDQSIGLSLSLPLSPDAVWDGDTIRFPDGTAIEVWTSGEVTSRIGEREPFDGWWSDTYGSMIPAPRLDVLSVTSPMAWAVSTDRSMRPHLVDDGSMAFGELTIRIRFDLEHVHLFTRIGDTSIERSIT
jgi:hypothetical protein